MPSECGRYLRGLTVSQCPALSLLPTAGIRGNVIPPAFPPPHPKPAVTGCAGDRKQDYKTNREPAVPAWLLSQPTPDSHLPHLSLGVGTTAQNNCLTRAKLGVMASLPPNQIRYIERGLRTKYPVDSLSYNTYKNPGRWKLYLFIPILQMKTLRLCEVKSLA